MEYPATWVIHSYAFLNNSQNDQSQSQWYWSAPKTLPADGIRDDEQADKLIKETIQVSKQLRIYTI